MFEVFKCYVVFKFDLLALCIIYVRGDACICLVAQGSHLLLKDSVSDLSNSFHWNYNFDTFNPVSYVNKTQPTAISPEKYLNKSFAKDERLQKEALALIDFFAKVTGSPCVMWNKLFGFGKYYYFDSKGGEHEYLMTGFAISSTGFTLYNLMGWERYKKDIAILGKYKFSGKSCLAIKSIKDIDLKILAPVIKRLLADMKKEYRIEK